MSRYDVVFEDPYCYSSTSVLKNKAGIKNERKLSAFELEMSTLRADEPLPSGKFDPVHYCKVHRHMFQDVYEWAGKYRTVRTAKGGNHFCFPEHIASFMRKLFARLSTPVFNKGATSEEFIQAAADFLAELNAIHAFREGNGRSQLAFMHLLAIRAGHPLDLKKIIKRTFLPAMIRSFDGDLKPLEKELTKLLHS